MRVIDRTTHRLDQLLRTLGVTTSCLVTDNIGATIHAFVPYHVAPLVLMFLHRERCIGQCIKVSSLNLIMGDDDDA